MSILSKLSALIARDPSVEGRILSALSNPDEYSRKMSRAERSKARAIAAGATPLQVALAATAMRSGYNGAIAEFLFRKEKGTYTFEQIAKGIDADTFGVDRDVYEVRNRIVARNTGVAHKLNARAHIAGFALVVSDNGVAFGPATPTQKRKASGEAKAHRLPELSDLSEETETTPTRKARKPLALPPVQPSSDTDKVA